MNLLNISQRKQWCAQIVRLQCLVLFCITLVFSPSGVCSAQNRVIDSLQGVMVSLETEGQPKEKALVAVLIELSEKYNEPFIMKPQAAILIAEKALTLARKGNHHESEADALLQIGHAKYFLRQYSESLIDFQKVTELYKKYTLKAKQARSYALLANVYNAQYLYESAIEYKLKSFALYDEIGDYTRAGGELVNAGNIFSWRSQHKQAIALFTKAIATFNKIPQDSLQTRTKVFQSNVFSAMGNSLRELGELEQALSVLKQGLRIREDLYKINQQRYAGAIADSYIHLAATLCEMGDTNALAYFEKIIGLKAWNQEFISKLHGAFLARLFVKMQRFDTALSLAQKALTVSDSTQSISWQKEARLSLAEAYDSLRQRSLASRYRREARELFDSAMQIESENRLQQLKANLEIEKRNDLLAKDNENQKLSLALRQAALSQKEFESAHLLRQLEIAGLSDSLQALELEKKRAQLSIEQSLARQQQQSILLLNQNKKLDEEQILRQRDEIRFRTFMQWLLVFVILSAVIGLFWLTKLYREKREANVQIVAQKNSLEQQAIEIQFQNTELQESLETLRRTQTQLAQAEKMASLGTLVAGVAHELNTPIGVAVTAASTLHGKVEKFENEYKAGGLKKSTLESFMDNAKIGADLTLRNLERAANLIQSFKQVAVDQTSDSKRVINLKHYLEGVITSLEPKWKTTQHRVEIECDERVELETYPGAIAQIITNLVTNSLLHGFEGYREDGLMKIEVEREGEKVMMKYSDNGRGIPPEVLPRIFDPFFTTKQAQGGTGLGMHIVYNLVTQKLGGEIRCASQPDTRTAFTITLPY